MDDQEMYTRRAIEEIDQLTAVTRIAERRYHRFKEWGADRLAHKFLNVATALLDLKTELVSLERKREAMKEALLKERVEEGA